MKYLAVTALSMVTGKLGNIKMFALIKQDKNYKSLIIIVLEASILRSIANQVS